MGSILILDNNNDLNELYCEFIASHGHFPIAARSISEALQLFSEHSFDLILSNFNLDQENALCFIESLRPLDKEIVVLVIVPSYNEFKELFKLHHGVVVFEKPFVMDVLMSVIERVLQVKKKLAWVKI